MICGRGGTGRRAALRSLWGKTRGSSSLLGRTIRNLMMSNKTEDIIVSFREQFDPALVSEIITSIDSGDKKSVLHIINKLPSSDIADIINLLKSSEREASVSYTHLTLPTTPYV